MLKFLLVAGLVCVAAAIGFGVGYSTGWRQRLDDPELSIRSSMREAIASQNSETALGLGVLLLLEKGDAEKAKSIVARQVAEYQHSWAKYEGVISGEPKLMPMILQAVDHSPALREEIARISN